MFGKIFGKKEEMYDMAVYWYYDVDINDFVTDLDILGQLMERSSAFKNGCRIIRVRDYMIDDTNYRTAELYVDKATEKFIREAIQNERFAAAVFSSTDMTKNGKAV